MIRLPAAIAASTGAGAPCGMAASPSGRIRAACPGVVGGRRWTPTRAKFRHPPPRHRGENGGVGGLGVVLGEVVACGDVPAGVVVDVERRLPVAGCAGGVQVAGGGEDRVPGVVGVRRRARLGGSAATCVLAQVPGRIASSRSPGDGGREVVPEVGLDLVDRRQVRPTSRPELVAAGGLLVDRQQVRGNAWRAARTDRPAAAHCACELAAANASITAISGTMIVSANAVTNSRRTAHGSTPAMARATARPLSAGPGTAGVVDARQRGRSRSSSRSEDAGPASRPISTGASIRSPAVDALARARPVAASRADPTPTLRPLELAGEPSETPPRRAPAPHRPPRPSRGRNRARESRARGARAGACRLRSRQAAR